MEEKDSKVVGNVIGAIVSAIVIYIVMLLVNKYYSYIPFVTDKFEQILPLYNLSLTVSIFLTAARAIFRSEEFKNISEIINNIFFCVIAYNLWIIYPFDTSSLPLSSLLDILIKFFIIIPPVIATIASVVTLVKLIINLLKK